MNQKIVGYIRANKVYLAIALSLFCSLFILGYQYIHNVNSKQPDSQIKVEEQVTHPAKPDYTPGDALVDLKLSRDRERSRELERVQGLLEQAGLSEQGKKEAETELWRLNQVTEKESELEKVLSANGFRETLVTVGHNSVTVVITSRLKTEEAERIGGMAAEVTGFNIEEVRIVEQI
jgi:stage III sporulation protein AH